MDSASIEELAKVLYLPSDEELAIDAQETYFHAHFSDNPGTYFALADEDGHLKVDEAGNPIFDPVAIKAYERDLQQIYDKVFRESAKAKPRRKLRFNDLGLKLTEVCTLHPMPVVKKAPSKLIDESNRFPFEIARSLLYDLRYAAKLAQNDAQEYNRLAALQNSRVGISYLGATALTLSMMAASFFGAYFGMGLAVDEGINKAKKEFREETDMAINRARDELREELDDAVSDYSWGYLRRSIAPEQNDGKKIEDKLGQQD
jgi:cytochrome P450